MMTPTPTSDNQHELFALVDSTDRVIGQATRGECHRNPTLIHRSIQILIFNSRGELLLQKRSLTKDLYPGAYCASASGHVDLGENYAEAAQREVREELGVAPPLQFVTRLLISDAHETEMTAIFTAQHEGPFRLHPQEVADVSFFSLPGIALRRATQEFQVTTALSRALEYRAAHSEQFPPATVA